MNIEGKAALITGGASGLGRATAEVLLAAGASVLIADLPGSDGEAVAKELGRGTDFAPTDVTSPADVEGAVRGATENFGGLHIAVNCAGVGTPGRVLSREGAPIGLEAFERVVRVNLIGTFNVIRVAAAQMSKQEPEGEERGVIINTSSVAAFDGQIGQAAYAASKGGVAGLTLPVARDLAKRLIRCVSIAPGTFDTPMVAGLGQAVQEGLAAQTPHPARLGKPSEYAILARHVVENPMLNGETIRLDGALRMPPR
ncbi:MAG: SDR family NAD(P)-dependent oxidoreductase [Actinobacteria bacterium]|nr:SDR family NAD(P)-dependent oxidoreductase [Actinomycetota bacterium]